MTSTIPYHSYYISDILCDHTSEVRSVLTFSQLDNALVSASYDKTLRIWLKKENISKYTVGSTLIGHEDYVMTIAEANGKLYTAGHDCAIIQWGDNAIPEIIVEQAHSGTISSLFATKEFLVAGSWDHNASIWDISNGNINTKPRYILSGHTNHIDSVLALPNGTILTGSRDHSIRLWDIHGTCIHTLNEAHDGSIRGFCIVPKFGFASVGSDGLLRLWNNQGVSLTNWTAHDSLVYHVSYIPEVEAPEGSGTKNVPLLVTSSEDQSIKIWTCDGILKQRIEFPSCVWQTTVFPNGDIAVACADSKIYILTTQKSKSISEDELQSISRQIKESKERRTGVEPSKLPDVSILKTLKGSKSGEHKIVNENGQPIVYIWNGSDWEKFGSVVDDPALQGKEMNNDDGKMYDRVWKVEVSDGVHLSLGYNFGEDPVEVAILFCQNNNLPSYFVDQIVEFIKKNSGQEYKPDMSKSRSFDPYHDSNTTTSKSLLDIEKEKDHFPIKSVETISSISNPDAIIKKIRSFNDELIQSNSPYSLSPNEISIFENACKQLSSPNDANYSPEFFAIMEKFFQWPIEKRFPSFDVLRVVLLSSDSEKYYSNRYMVSQWNLAKQVISNCLSDTSNFALPLMGLRSLVNMCKWPSLHPQIIESLSEFMLVSPQLLTINKDPVRVTIGRFLLNLSYVVHKQPGEIKQKVLENAICITPIYSSASTPQTREEFAYDFIRCIGTLCLISVLKAEEDICRRAKLMFSEFVSQCETSSSSVKVQAAAFQLSQVFSATS